MNVQPNLSSQQWRILEFLAQATDWCTRQDMYAFVGTEKGYSKALGAPNGTHHPNSLETLGLVERRGENRLMYKITPDGRRVVQLHVSAIGTARHIQPRQEQIAVETDNVDRSDNRQDHTPTQVVPTPIARPILKDDDIVRSPTSREAPHMRKPTRPTLLCQPACSAQLCGECRTIYGG